MTRWLGPFSDRIYAITRFVFGFLFAFHGAQKLFGAFGGQKVELASLMGLAGIIEFFGGILIAIGLVASWAAFIASGQMAVAYFMAHFSMAAFWPIQNKGEAAVLFCFFFLYVAARGAGPWSVDAAMRKRPRK